MSFAMPQSNDATVNNAMPYMKMRRRPNWSLTFPAIGNATTMPRL